MAEKMRMGDDFESDRVLLQHSIAKCVKSFFDKWGLSDIAVSVVTLRSSFLMTDDGKGHTGPSFACDVVVDNELIGDDVEDDDE